MKQKKFKTLTDFWQWLVDLEPTATCRCRIINGQYADCCYAHYNAKDDHDKKIVDLEMAQQKELFVKC